MDLRIYFLFFMLSLLIVDFASAQVCQSYFMLVDPTLKYLQMWSYIFEPI